MNILILGSSGYLGSNLVEFLSYNSQYKITCFDRTEPPFHSKYIKYQCIIDDIFNIKKHINIVRQQDIIVNFIGSVGTLNSFSNYKGNVYSNNLSTLELLDTIKDFSPSPLLVYISTRLVYSKFAKSPIQEVDELEPLTIYGINKLASEKYITAYNNLYRIPYIILRLSIPYGSYYFDINTYGIINYFIKTALNNDTITLYGNGKQKRDILCIEDLVRNLETIILNSEYLKNDIYNFGGEEILSLKDIANLVINILKKGNVSYIEWPQKEKRIETYDSYIDSSYLKNKIKLSYEFTINKYLESIKDQFERYNLSSRKV